MLTNKRVLVVEAEFLLALDLQRMLEQAHAAETIFARSIEEAARLSDIAAQFDLAIIDVPPAAGPATALASCFRASGIAVMATSTEPGFRHGIPGLDGIPVLHKPFAESDLLAACITALAGAPEND